MTDQTKPEQEAVKSVEPAESVKTADARREPESGESAPQAAKSDAPPEDAAPEDAGAVAETSPASAAAESAEPAPAAESPAPAEVAETADARPEPESGEDAPKKPKDGASAEKAGEEPPKENSPESPPLTWRGLLEKIYGDGRISRLTDADLAEIDRTHASGQEDALNDVRALADRDADLERSRDALRFALKKKGNLRRHVHVFARGVLERHPMFSRDLMESVLRDGAGPDDRRRALDRLARLDGEAISHLMRRKYGAPTSEEPEPEDDARKDDGRKPEGKKDGLPAHRIDLIRRNAEECLLMHWALEGIPAEEMHGHFCAFVISGCRGDGEFSAEDFFGGGDRMAAALCLASARRAGEDAGRILEQEEELNRRQARMARLEDDMARLREELAGAAARADEAERLLAEERGQREADRVRSHDGMGRLVGDLITDLRAGAGRLQDGLAAIRTMEDTPRIRVARSRMEQTLEDLERIVNELGRR